MCADTQSLLVIADEISKAYASDDLSDVPLQYLQFSEWLNGFAEEEDAEAAVAEGAQRAREGHDALARVTVLRRASPVAALA